MDFYTLTAIKFALGILTMLLQINILGKRDFSLNTPLNQVQNYVLGGIIGGVIYNSSDFRLAVSRHHLDLVARCYRDEDPHRYQQNL